jgi:hypothetical protein
MTDTITNLRSFQSLKVGDYFHFDRMDHQIRKKVSIRKYIWISDGDTVYCNSPKDEENAYRWVTMNRHLNKVVKIDRP